MTRKDIEEKYSIVGKNEDIMLFRKSTESTNSLGYCGNIALKNGKAVFGGKAYSDIASLDKALVAWEKSLMYPVDTYCPMLRDGYRVESRIVWHLTERLGFGFSKSDFQPGAYERKIGPNASIKVVVQHEFDEGTVSIVCEYGDMTFSQSVTDADHGIAVIDSIVSGGVLMMAKDIVDLISSCGDEVTTDIDAYVSDKNAFFGLKPTDFKSLMVSRLEMVLVSLKGE